MDSRIYSPTGKFVSPGQSDKASLSTIKIHVTQILVLWRCLVEVFDYGSCPAVTVDSTSGP